MPSAEYRRLALSSSIQALTRAQNRRVPIVHRRAKRELDARAASGHDRMRRRRPAAAPSLRAVHAVLISCPPWLGTARARQAGLPKARARRGERRTWRRLI
jgi:hypothetical protein